jgi:adenylosuccinate synthase
LRAELQRCLDLKNALFTSVYHKPRIELAAMVAWAQKYGDLLKPYIDDTITLLDQAQAARQRILLEAQLGTLRDIHYGIYPYTTSSCPLAGFGAVGAGLFGPQKELPQITGVMKAFATCVGAGPFVTEMPDVKARALREIALEYGAKTGRARRIGYFDVVASRYGAKLQNATELALTKLDCLSGHKTLKICTHYQLGNRQIDDFPITPELLQVKPVYIELPGWDADLSQVRQFDQLPAAAQQYVQTLEELVSVPIRYISVGPERAALIIR